MSEYVRPSPCPYKIGKLRPLSRLTGKSLSRSQPSEKSNTLAIEGRSKVNIKEVKSPTAGHRDRTTKFWVQTKPSLSLSLPSLITNNAYLIIFHTFLKALVGSRAAQLQAKMLHLFDSIMIQESLSTRH